MAQGHISLSACHAFHGEPGAGRRGWGDDELIAGAVVREDGEPGRDR
jgi:hypothetical protein